MTNFRTWEFRGRRSGGRGYKLLKFWSNRLMGTFRNPYSRVYYVVEGHDWSIDWDGSYISRYVLGLTGTYCRTTETYD